MTGPEHYHEAEELARIAARHPDADDSPVLAQLATAHALLANAAATAMQAAVDGSEPGMGSLEFHEWYQVAGVKPPKGGAVDA